ncbi:MAG: hypothetical protein AB1416_10225, partial [Actinomycetota bacterium]
MRIAAIVRRVTALAATALAVGASLAAAAPGDPDTTLGAGGRLVVDLPNDLEENPRAVARDSQGRLIVAGEATVEGVTRPFVMRFLPSGAVDANFAGTGVTYPIGTTPGTAHTVVDVAVDGSDRVLVAGTRISGGVDGMYVKRLTANGFSDGSFDGDGLATPTFPFVDEHVRGIAVQQDGKILLAGEVRDDVVNPRMAVARLLATGAVDTAWGGDGLVDVDPTAGFDALYGVTELVLENGTAILATGQAGGSAAGSKMAVLRLNPDTGAPLAGFDGDGLALVDFGSSTDEGARDVVGLDPNLATAGDERVIVAGLATSAFPAFGATPEIPQVALAALNLATGALDGAFDGDGKVLTRLDTNNTGDVHLLQGGLAAHDPDPNATGGETVTVGGALSPEGQDPGDPLILRYSAATGALDPAFATDGSAAFPVGRPVIPQDVVLDGDKPILLAETAGGGGDDTVLVKATAAGAADTTFDTDGARITDLGELAGDRLVAAAPDPAGGAVVAGATTTAGASRILVARVLAAGGLDPAFSGDGAAAPDLPPALSFVTEEVTSVAVHADRRIVVTGYGRTATATVPFIARLTPEGLLDATFDTDGVRTLDVTPTTTMPVSPVGIDREGRAVTVAESSGKLAVWRFTAAGAPDPSFGGGDGVVELTATGITLFPPAAPAFGPDGRIAVVGNTSSGGNGRSLAWVLTPAGEPDATFASGGPLTVDLTATGRDGVTAARLGSDGRLTLLGNTVEPNGSGVYVVPNGSRLWTGRYLPDGTPDTSYPPGGAGVMGATAAFAVGGTFQPDGRPLAVLHGFAFARGDTAGAFDATFGTSGRASFFQAGDLVDAFGGAGAVSQADGRPLAALTVRSGGKRTGLVARQIGDSADLSVAIAAPATATTGDLVTATVTVTGAGPQDALDTNVTLTLPSGVELVSVTAVDGTCQSGPSPSCRFAVVPAGATRTVTATLRPTAAGTVTLQAAIDGPTFDPTTGDRTASAAITVADPPPAVTPPAVTPPAVTPPAVTPPAPDPDVAVTGDRTAPRLTLRITRTGLAALLRRGLRVTVKANEAATGRIVLRLRGPKGPVLAAAKVRLAAGRA